MLLCVFSAADAFDRLPTTSRCCFARKMPLRETPPSSGAPRATAASDKTKRSSPVNALGEIKEEGRLLTAEDVREEYTGLEGTQRGGCFRKGEVTCWDVAASSGLGAKI
ncbi:hypothetical protein MRX96_042702 [Rhipicephalus microplus]